MYNQDPRNGVFFCLSSCNTCSKQKVTVFILKELNLNQKDWNLSQKGSNLNQKDWKLRVKGWNFSQKGCSLNLKGSNLNKNEWTLCLKGCF